MRSRVLALLVFLAPCAPACAGDAERVESSESAVTSWDATYAALADARVPPTLDAVSAELAALDEATLPHEAKALRKRIGELRDYVYLFSFAYDKKGPGDPWLDLRDDLDEGYEEAGAFKDLFDAQGLELAVKDATGAWGPGVRPEDVTYPDLAEVARRRARVLAWRDAFAERVAGYRAYVARADARKMHDHDDQSKFFWGGAGIEPDRKKSGLENLSALTRALLERAEEDFDAIAHLEEVTAVDDHEHFHDLRKRVRSIVKVLGYYPELREPSAEAPLAVMTELVDRYGSLNDKILAYDLETKKSKRKKLAEAIEAEWKEVKKWQRKQDVDEQFDRLRKRIRKHG